MKKVAHTTSEGQPYLFPKVYIFGAIIAYFDDITDLSFALF